ncbi:MAG: response regulator transcription factor [Chloroflexi bacterium]|nr:response regulator transcription factor [Chloroflexota bacterium]
MDTGGKRLLYITTEDADERLFDIMKTLRAAGGDCGIVVFCPCGDPEREAMIVERGADDCIPVSVDLAWLLTRLRATAARLRRSAPALHQAKPIEVEPSTYRVKVNGTSVSLSPMQFQLLMALWNNEGRVVTHQVLQGLLWHETSAASREALKHLVMRLRRRLGPMGYAVRPVPGVGYLLEQAPFILAPQRQPVPPVMAGP